MARTKDVTMVSAPGLPWRVVHNGSHTDTLTPANAVKFAASIYKQGQNAYIQHFVNGEWANAETETQRAMSKVAGFNPGAVSALTQFIEYSNYVLKQAPKKNGLTDAVIGEWVAEVYSTAKAMGVTRATLESAISAHVFIDQEQEQLA